MADVQEPQPQAALSDGIWIPALKEAGVAFLTAALLLAIFYALAFRWIHPEFVPFMDREATKLIVPGKALIPVSVGGYRVEGGSAIIEDFNVDEAILALPRSFQAEDYPFIKVNLQGFTRYSKFKILWRRADDPSQTHALEFNRSGDEVTQIAMVYGNENYHGQIADIALLFYDGPAIGFENNNGTEITLESVEFRPFSALNVAEQIYEDWANAPLLRGYSNNIVVGIHNNGIIYPNLASNAVLLLSVLVIAVRRNRWLNEHPVSCAPVGVVLLALILYSWALNDALRWQWRTEQLLDTWERYAGLSLEDRIKNNPMRCARFPKDCKAELLPYF